VPRPPLKPTDTQRQLVKAMAAVGIPHEDIARKLGIRSPKTLRKHFRDELTMGIIDANYKVGKTLYEMATSGEEPSATIFWAKMRGLLRAGSGEGRGSPAAPAFIVELDSGGPGGDPA